MRSGILYWHFVDIVWIAVYGESADPGGGQGSGRGFTEAVTGVCRTPGGGWFLWARASKVDGAQQEAGSQEVVTWPLSL